MDPILLAALEKLQTKMATLKDMGTAVTPAHIEEFLKAQTGGKYGYKDYADVAGMSPTNLAISGVQGATFGFGDNILNKLDPKGKAGEEMRTRQAMFKGEHPWANGLTSLAGGLASGGLLGRALKAVGLASEATSVAQAARQGAGAGMAMGAAQGAGDADGPDQSRLAGAATGGAVGGVTGGLLGGALGTATALVSPERHGIARITNAIEKEGGLDAVKAQLAKAVANARGGVVTLADLGPHLRQALDFAANASDDVLVPTAELLQSRNAGRAARLLADARAGFAEQNMGEPDAGRRALELKANTQQIGTGYDKLAEQNPSFDISSLPLDKGLIASKWNQARTAGNLTAKGPLDDLIAKLTAANPGAPKDALEAAAKQIAGASAQDAGAAAPALERPATLADLQQLRRSVAGMGDAAWTKGNGAMGKALNDIRDHIDNVTDAGAPGFKELNAQYKGAKDLERALPLGEEWWMKADHRQLDRVVETLKQQPGALDEFRTGIASKLVEKLQSTKDNRDVAKEFMDASEDLDAKLRVIFGDKGTFDTFMNKVKSERELSKLGSTLGNSATVRRFTAQGLDPAHLGIDVATHGTSAVTRAGAAMAKSMVTRHTAQAMGPSLLTRGAPNIEALLASLGKQSKLLDPSTTMAAGALPAGLMSLFDRK